MGDDDSSLFVSPRTPAAPVEFLKRTPKGREVLRRTIAKKKKTGYEYIKEKTEPREQRQIRKAEELVGRLPSSVRGGFGELVLRRAAIGGYKGLTPEEKTEYGKRFVDWESVPPSEIKHIPGGKSYLERVSPSEKKRLVKEYLGRHKIEHDPWWAFGSTWRVNGRPIEGLRTSGVSDKELREKIAWEEITMTSPEIKSKIYSELPWYGRHMYAGMQALSSAVMWPVTLGQTGVKYVTGKGRLTDPLGRISTGKPLVFPDVGKELGERRIGPGGLISTGMSELITWGASEEWEKTQKYPFEAFSATVGEVFGMGLGGKTIGGITKGIGREMRNLWVGLRGKYIPIERLTTQKVLSGESAFPTSPSARVSLLKFKEAYDPTSGMYKVTHATPDAFKGLRITKGTSEFGHRGLFVTPEHMTSPYFLKLGSPYKTSFKITLFPKIHRASILRFKVPRVSRVPEPYRLSQYKFGEFVRGKFDTAWITAKHEMGGPEIEALLVEHTPLTKITPPGWLGKIRGYEHYTKLWGRRIPIREFGIDLDLPVSGMKSMWETLSGYSRDLASYYYKSHYVPLVQPSYITYGVSSLLSYKPSYTPSYTPSYKPSILPSYKPSYTPSYKIPSIAKYMLSYKPSYTPSYKPPSLPPSVPSYYKPSYKKTYPVPSLPVPVAPKIPIEIPELKLKRRKYDSELFGKKYKYRAFNIEKLLKGVGF